ncbi:MAG: hypothetical protein WA061_07505 [Microgenomates group bacterium]
MSEARAHSFGPGAEVLSQFLVRSLPSIQLYQGDRISRQKLIATLRPIFRSEYDKILAMEREAVAKADVQLGLQSQTTDTVGSHNLKWFDETGLAYSTGLPTTAIAVAIIHPEIGMSATHMNLITGEDVIQKIATAAKSTLAQGMMETASEEVFARMMAPNESMHAVAAKAMKNAMSAFARLTPSGVPLKGTQISIMGGNFLTQSQQDDLAQAAISTTRAHPAMNDGRARVGGRTIDFSNQLGGKEPLGMVWGGQRHPQYSTPTYYSLGNLIR